MAATTTTTTTTDATSTRSKGNPKDSMASTWRVKDRSTWGVPHWFLEVLGLHSSDLSRATPVHAKTEKVPYTPEWEMHRWCIFHALVPMVIHQAYTWYTGNNLSGWQAFIFYSLSFKGIAIHELHALRRIGHQIGFLDGDVHERDGVPDVGVMKTVRSLLSTSTVRPIFTVLLSYSADVTPMEMNWRWVILEVGLYGIILDFWFYWYHRLMHEVSWLWQYHRTHHLTKHPNPLLTLYADLEQEFFDIAGIPLLTYFSMRFLGMPMGFYEWWIAHQFVAFSELAGHSGLRVHSPPPNPFTIFMRWTGTELLIEDHDLHHRKGWKSSGNYGKQTRIWDKIFGTMKDRIELTPDNIDYNNRVHMPLFWWN